MYIRYDVDSIENGLKMRGLIGMKVYLIFHLTIAWNYFAVRTYGLKIGI